MLQGIALLDHAVLSATFEHIDVALSSDVYYSPGTLRVLFQLLSQSGYVYLDDVLSLSIVGLIPVDLPQNLHTAEYPAGRLGENR